MKKLLMGAAFVALLASPALAQSYDPNLGTGNIVPAPGGIFAGSVGNNAYAYAPRAHAWRQRGLRAQAMAPAPDAVYTQGQYAGQDPDANVRLELRRDWADIHE